MALAKCKECGNEISTKATACPKCGAKPAKPTGAFTWIIGGMFAIGVYSCVSSSRDQTERTDAAAAAEAARVAAMTPTQRADAEKRKAAEAALQVVAAQIEDAAIGCRLDVTKRLKDPDSAKWEDPWYGNAKFSENGQRIKITLAARSKNSFGAFTRSAFDCDARRSAGSWTTISIKENK